MNHWGNISLATYIIFFFSNQEINGLNFLELNVDNNWPKKDFQRFICGLNVTEVFPSWSEASIVPLLPFPTNNVSVQYTEPKGETACWGHCFNDFIDVSLLLPLIEWTSIETCIGKNYKLGLFFCSKFWSIVWILRYLSEVESRT